MGREGDLDRPDSSGDVWVIGHRPSEGGNTAYGQVDLFVQSAPAVIAEELADKADLTKGAEGVDQTNDVAVKLQRKTSACNDGG
jgi:hypothetical protein